MGWTMSLKVAKVFTQGISSPKTPRLLLPTHQQGQTLFHRYEGHMVVNS